MAIKKTWRSLQNKILIFASIRVRKGKFKLTLNAKIPYHKLA